MPYDITTKRALTNIESLLRLVKASDNFALSANKDPGPEGFILLNEKEAIMAEMKKIVDFLQVR